MRASDQQTGIQAPAAGYEDTVLRRQPRVQWTDVTGEHEQVIASRVVAGSAGYVDLVVGGDAAVSRLHAELDPREDGVWVRDLGSRNGTFVEGVRVSLACVPASGRVRVGATTLQVSYAAPPEPVSVWPSDRCGPLVGQSVVMRDLFARLVRYAATDSTVLIQGETGTGKELVAQAIHEASPRAHGPFLVVDCGALPENLLESELFGHARGAFTGAIAARAGAIEAAAGGTVFLDEIGELPLAMQPRLLRALESRTVRRIGETEPRRLDVRFLSATHRDLRQMVNARVFREDLFFRLSVLPLAVPPLREHLEDVPLLIQSFLRPGTSAAITPDLMRELSTRTWLGNVRELRNLVERVVAVGPREALHLESTADLHRAATGFTLPPELLALPLGEARELLVARLEQDYVRELLARHDGNVSAAAHAAGLNRSYLHRVIRRHRL